LGRGKRGEDVLPLVQPVKEGDTTTIPLREKPSILSQKREEKENSSLVFNWRSGKKRRRGGITPLSRSSTRPQDNRGRKKKRAYLRHPYRGKGGEELGSCEQCFVEGNAAPFFTEGGKEKGRNRDLANGERMQGGSLSILFCRKWVFHSPRRKEGKEEGRRKHFLNARKESEKRKGRQGGEGSRSRKERKNQNSGLSRGGKRDPQQGPPQEEMPFKKPLCRIWKKGGRRELGTRSLP